MSKKESSFRQLSYPIIIITLLALFLVKVWILDNVIYSICCSVLGGESIWATLSAYIVSYVVVGVLATLPIYWHMRDNGGDHRRFLAYFAENEYNSENLKKYLKHFKNEKWVFALALVTAVALTEDISLLLLNPAYFIVAMLGIALVYLTYIIFVRIARRKLYDKWYRERMHRG